MVEVSFGGFHYHAESSYRQSAASDVLVVDARRARSACADAADHGKQGTVNIARAVRIMGKSPA
jgi:hypothetical protein